MGNLIVKDNALVEASHRLSEIEQRLVLLAILKARNVGDTVEQLKDKMLTIHADDYIKTFGVDRDASYLALKKAVMGLYRAEWGYKYINEKGNTVVRYERFTQSAEYVDGEGTVRFMFSTAIIPMLIELERRFTSYEIEQVANLSSQYAMRLYEFLIQHLDKNTNKGWFDISLDDLRFRFGLLPTEYIRMGDFKKGVLDLAVKQINKNTDLSASYEQKKQGRTIVGFKFTFKRKAATKKPKTQKQKDDIRDPNTPDLLDGYTDQERQIIEQKREYARQNGITDPTHIQNLINHAIDTHRKAAKAEKEHEIKKKAEYLNTVQQELARLEAERLKEQQEKEELNRQADQVDEIFNKLSEFEQEEICKQVSKNYLDNQLLYGFFIKAVKERRAHIDRRFMKHFCKIFGVE